MIQPYVETPGIEQWRPVVGFPDYEVSDYSRIRVLERIRSGRTYPSKILVLNKDKDGYVQVHLAVDSKRISRRVHLLVAIAFIPNPENLPQVLHGDDDPGNPALSNLSWGSASTNLKQCWDRSRRQYNSYVK